jgi:hypothetical protein
MKFCGLNPTGSLAVTTATTVLLLNASPIEARRRGGGKKNNNNKASAGHLKGLFGQGDLKFFLNSNNNGNNNSPTIQKPSFGGFGFTNEFNPSFPNECQPTPENLNSATNSIKCGCPKSVTGMGRGYFPGYVFDQDKMECVSFISGSAFQGRSLNFFATEQDCVGSCLVPERVVIKSGMDESDENNENNCSPSENQNPSNDQRCGCAPSQRGMQRGYFPGYIYDLENNKCVPLISGGYHGRTINWFTSEQDCIGSCIVPERVVMKSGMDENDENNENNCSPSENQNPSNDERCGCAPSQRGMQRGYFPGYIYDVENNKCVSLISGGYHGRTINWFTSEDNCKNACVVNEEPEENITLKFGFAFGGGSSDVEPDYDCLGEAQFPGMCRAMMTRFSYNSDSKKCQAQLYGGCGGYTTNSFPTMELCEETCTAQTNSETDDHIREALFPRVIEQEKEPELNLVSTFNQEEGFFLDDFLQSYSEEFQDDINLIFGCSDENPCACPKNVGRNGFGMKQRKWYFSSTANKCVDFVYKGFGGNQNRFNSEAECKQICVEGKSDDNNNSGSIEKIVDASACHDRYLGDMVNSCRAMVFRWSYNSVNNQCEKVIWGGCASFFGQALEDSKNNFATEGECKQTCKFESIIHGNGDRYTQRTISTSVGSNSPAVESNNSENNDNKETESSKYTPEPRCQESFNESEGNGFNNVYFIYDNTKSEPRCRRVSYSKPVIWFNKSANLFPRFIDCRRACQPELFAAKKEGRSVRY